MGTYGSFTLPFRGFSASQDCSVGYWSDHDAEAKAFQRRQEAAKGAIAARREPLQKIYGHFADGAHPWRRHVVHLDRERTTERADDYKARYELPSLVGADGDFTIHLYFKKGVAAVHREIALAGFILCQPFRAFFRIAPASTRPIAEEFERLFSGWGWTESCLGFPGALMMAHAREAEVRELARGSSEASANAALILSAMDGRPIPAEVVERLDVGLLIRFASDAQWPQIREHARVKIGDLGERDSVVREWWQPLFAEKGP